jgi:hypothetical protein
MEELLQAQNVKRRIRVITSDFHGMATALVGTDLVATMHTRLALACARRLPIRVLPLPYGLPPLAECLQWHRFQESDPCHIWLRGIMLEVARGRRTPNCRWRHLPSMRSGRAAAPRTSRPRPTARDASRQGSSGASSCAPWRSTGRNSATMRAVVTRAACAPTFSAASTRPDAPRTGTAIDRNPSSSSSSLTA